MDSSVTPTSPSEMVILVAGLLIMLFGVYKVYRERGRPGLLILWGGLVDLGLALMGLGLGPSGDVGSIMIVIYHAIARLAAWIGLSGLVANPYSCVANDIRGALHRNPVGAVLLAFALEASLGISPAMTPEGQHLVLHAMAMHSVDVPLGGPVLAIIMAAGYTVLLWLSAEVVLQVCFTRPDEPICTEVPLGGGAFAHALFDRETELMGVPSGSWCPFVPNRWSRTPAAISLYVLLGLLVALGLGRFLVQDFGAWLIGIDPHTLVELEGPWHVTPLLLYVGSFLVLCPRIIRPRHRATYTFALFAAAFAVICVTDLPPLSRLFSLIISGIGALVACYSTNYIEEDGRKHWYWFFLLLTFGALLNIVTTGTLSSQWEVMTWASFALVAWERTSKARDAAIKYVVLCCGAAYLMIVGFFMIGGDFTQYGEILANLSARPEDVLRFALVFTLLGFAAKAGLVPLHSWLPDAHPAAPSSVSAPLSGVLTKMGVFGVVMIYFGLLGYDGLAETGTYGGFTVPGLMVTVMGLCTMAYGEWMALRQEDIKRMLAYSTMGQVGEIFTVLGLGTWLAAAGALAHVLNHAIMKDLLFLCAGGLIFRVGSRKLSDLAGLVHEMPWAVGCMSIGIVSIMGLPPFNGFVSKYLMIVACMDAGQPLIAAALIAASLVGAIYYMRILRTILLDPAPAGRKRVEGVTATMRWPMIILAALCVILGVAPQTGLSLITPILDQLQFGPGVGGMLPTLPELDVSWPVYVLLPMFGAIVPIWFRKDRVKAGWGAAAILFLTTLHVLAFGRDLDMLSYVMALFIPAIGTVNLVYAVGYMEHSHTQWRFYAFFLLMTGGLLGVAASSDLFSFFTFWEIMSSWALYFAIAHEGTPEALREGFKYFLFNVAGAGFLFLGIGLIVAYTGTGQFAGVASGFAGLSPAVGTAIVALLAIGFCMKAAQVSLRIDWQMHPALAPTPVSGYISSVLLKIAVFGLVKLFLGFGSVYAQGASDLFSQATIMYVVAWVGAFTLLYSAVQAMLQNSLKLVFIWSTVSQIGYMVLGVAVGTSLGMAGGLLHMANHVFFKDLLFLMVGAVMLRTHADAISELGGVGRRMPVTMFCFFIGSLAAVGVPPTNGFTSKWIIYQALMAEGEPLLALISLIGSVVTLAYLARFMHTVFLGQPGRDLEHIEEAPWVMRAPMLLMAFMVILTGVFPGLLLAPLNEALVEYGMPSLDVASYGLASGPGAWDATSMAVLMLVAFGGGWLLLRFLLARVKVRVAAPHACGHDASQEATRIPPEGIYPALVNLCTGNKPGSATCSLPELALTCCRNLRRSLGRTGRINKERPSC